jgi:hypothetical protein
MQESSESAVDHLLLYDSAAMDLEAKSIQAVELGEKLVHSSSTLSSELRSMDILAARVSKEVHCIRKLRSIVDTISITSHDALNVKLIPPPNPTRSQVKAVKLALDELESLVKPLLK